MSAPTRNSDRDTQCNWRNPGDSITTETCPPASSVLAIALSRTGPIKCTPRSRRALRCCIKSSTCTCGSFMPGMLGQAVQFPVRSRNGVVPAFQTRRGAAQHNRTLIHLGPADGDIPAVVTRGLILFIGMIVFFIDNDQTEFVFRHRCKYCRPCARTMSALPFSTMAQC